jgi:hypothetical protein
MFFEWVALAETGPHDRSGWAVGIPKGETVDRAVSEETAGEGLARTALSPATPAHQALATLAVLPSAQAQS